MKPSFKISLIVAIAAAGLSAQSAKASEVTFDWSYAGSDPSVNGSPYTVSASGTFTAHLVSAGEYQIDTITGTRYDTIWGSQTIAVTNGFGSADNLLYYPGTPHLDDNGIGYQTEGLDPYYFANMFFGSLGVGGQGQPCSSQYCEFVDDFGVGYITTPLSSFEVSEVSSSATPLPAALPLFATGLGGLGFLGWRRKRKAQAVTA